jgi:transcriptional regulator with XRE-family HTH domain
MGNVTGAMLTRIGYRVRAARQIAGLNQSELADRAGISRSFVTRIESGSAVASISVLAQLSVALGVSMGQLIGDAPLTQRPEAAAIRLIEDAVSKSRGVPIPVRSKIKRGRIIDIQAARGRGMLHIPLDWIGDGNPDALFVIEVRDQTLIEDGFPQGTNLLIHAPDSLNIADTDWFLIEDRGEVRLRLVGEWQAIAPEDRAGEIIGILFASWRLHK